MAGKRKNCYSPNVVCEYNHHAHRLNLTRNYLENAHKRAYLYNKGATVSHHSGTKNK